MLLLLRGWSGDDRLMIDPSPVLSEIHQLRIEVQRLTQELKLGQNAELVELREEFDAFKAKIAKLGPKLERRAVKRAIKACTVRGVGPSMLNPTREVKISDLERYVDHMKGAPICNWWEMF